jgi:hypothetical protein
MATSTDQLRQKILKRALLNAGKSMVNNDLLKPIDEDRKAYTRKVTNKAFLRVMS